MSHGTKLKKNLAAMRFSKQPKVDGPTRAHYDAVAPALPAREDQRRGTAAAVIEDDDTEIKVVEPKRRSSDPHPYEKRVVVVSRGRILGAQG